MKIQALSLPTHSFGRAIESQPRFGAHAHDQLPASLVNKIEGAFGINTAESRHFLQRLVEVRKEATEAFPPGAALDALRAPKFHFQGQAYSQETLLLLIEKQGTSKFPKTGFFRPEYHKFALLDRFGPEAKAAAAELLNSLEEQKLVQTRPEWWFFGEPTVCMTKKGTMALVSLEANP